jgi:hypothetical protein
MAPTGLNPRPPGIGLRLGSHALYPDTHHAPARRRHGLQSPPLPNARVAKLVDARDLSNLSTRLGNGRREWGQIRGTSTTARRGDCNPELSLQERFSFGAELFELGRIGFAPGKV